MRNTLHKIRNNNVCVRWAARNFRFLLMAGGALLCGLMFGCNIISRTFPVGGSQREPPFWRELPPAAIPRAFEYANLKFTVTRAAISNREGPHARPVTDPVAAVAEITFSVVNTLPDTVRIPSGLWQLFLGDGSVYKQPYSEIIDPRDTKEIRLSFSVPLTAGWSGARLVLDEQGKEPATLVLDGNPEPAQYPVQLAPGGQAVTKDPSMAYTVKKASLELDSFGERAESGKCYLSLVVHVADKESSDNGEFLPEFFRLLVNGEPLLPKNTGENTTIDAQGTQDYTMAYLIPADVQSVELEVGKPEVQKTEKILIELKKNLSR